MSQPDGNLDSFPEAAPLGGGSKEADLLTLVVADNYEDLELEMVKRMRAPRHLDSVLDKVAEAEWVIAPSLGVRRWLTARVARSLGAQPARTDGIVANWTNDFPSQLTQRVLDAHLTAEFGMDSDPWSLPGLQFVIYDWALANRDATGHEMLTDGAGNIVLSRCRHVADLFDRYITWRPTMVLDWLNQPNPSFATDAPEEVEQAALFRAIRAEINVPCPAERWDAAWEQLPSYIDELPARDRVSIFGLSSFPGGLRYVDAIERLSRHLEVTVYAARPFAVDVKEIGYQRERFASTVLQLWGGAGVSQAEMIDALASRATNIVNVESRPSPVEGTLLGALQRSLHADISERVAVDTSVVVHEAHGPARQAEILRDAILHQLNETGTDGHPALTESDILVVCPRLEEFEPLIRTAFGPAREFSTSDPQPGIAYKVTDRSLTHDGLYLQGVIHFLELVRGRCSRSEVLSFLAEPTVRRARRITDDGAELFAAWTREAGIRWGLDARHRERFGLGKLGEFNSWRAGLRRLAFGAFIENPRLRSAHSILPVEVAPSHLDQLVALSSAVNDLTLLVADTWAPQNLDGWLKWFDRGSRALLAPGPRDGREYERVLGALKPLRDTAVHSTSPLPFADFLWLLEETFSSIGSTSSVLTGGVTITSPDTLRGIPFPSVFILGLDDDAFTSSDWERNDLRRLHGEPGDLSPADDARGRLREVILAAGERLTVLRSGRHVTNNEEVKPGTAFSELRDAIRMVNVDSSDPITVAHPRNSYSPANFEATAEFSAPLRSHELPPEPWSYSQLDLSLASTNPAERQTRDALTDFSELQPDMPDSLSLGDLERFLKNPPELFVKRTLGISLPSADLDRSDDLDITGRGLLEANVIRTLYDEQRDDHRSTTGPVEGFGAMVASGVVPPPPIFPSERVIPVATELARLVEGAVSQGTRRQVPVSLEFQGTEIYGDIDVIENDEGTTLVEIITSKISLRHLAGVWLRTAALRATLDGPLTLHLVYRPRKPELGEVGLEHQRVPIEERTNAVASLDAVVQLFRANLLTPIPFCLGEKPSRYVKPALSEERWQHREFKPDFDAKYLGDPYWQLALGHLSADDVLADSSSRGYAQVLTTMRGIFSSVVNLFLLAANNEVKK